MYAVSHQVVLSKVDRVLFPKGNPSFLRLERNRPQLDEAIEILKTKIQPGKGDGPEALGEIITCSGEKTMNGMKMGVDNVRWAILAAVGLENEKKKRTR